MRITVIYETVDGSGGEKCFDSIEEAEEFITETKDMWMGAKMIDRNTDEVGIIERTESDVLSA